MITYKRANNLMSNPRLNNYDITRSRHHHDYPKTCRSVSNRYGRNCNQYRKNCIRKVLENIEGMDTQFEINGEKYELIHIMLILALYKVLLQNEHRFLY